MKVLTTARNLYLSWARCNQSTTSCPISWRYCWLCMVGGCHFTLPKPVQSMSQQFCSTTNLTKQTSRD